MRCAGEGPSSAVDIFNQCPAGCFFSNLTCGLCAAGSYSLSGQLSCTDCPSGSYCPDPARDPQLCPAGSYCPAKSCAPALCRSESYSGSGQPSCSDCPSGSYCPDQCGSPVICPAGSYCPAKSGTFVKCDAGFICSKEGLSQQSPCPPGHYCPSSVQDVPCPAGTFSSATGRVSVFFDRVVARNRACYFPRTRLAGANSHSLCRTDVFVHLPALLPFAELP